MAKDIQAIIKEVEEIFIDVLEKDDIRLTAETTAQDVPEWDSLTHIQLIIAIEKHFKVRFTASQIQSWKNVGAMCEALQQKLN